MSEYSPNELQKLQLLEIQILEEVHNICISNNIEYFIIGGTTLGAIRHGGFIPWDDDIDIGMTRENYQKFLELAPNYLSSKYFVQNFLTEPHSPFYFTKVRLNNTVFVEEYCKDLNINHGVFLDIFPYDNIPSNKLFRKLQHVIVLFLNNLYISSELNDVFYNNSTFKSVFNKILRKISYYFMRFISKGLVFKLLDKTCQMFNNKDTDIVGFVKLPFLNMHRKEISPLIKIRFDRLDVYAPNDCNAYLTRHFGNYMILPSKDKQYGHRPYRFKI